MIQMWNTEEIIEEDDKRVAWCGWRTTEVILKTNTSGLTEWFCSLEVRFLESCEKFRCYGWSFTWMAVMSDINCDVCTNTIRLTRWFFSLTVRFSEKSRISQNTPVVIITNAVKGNSFWSFQNEIPDDTIEEDIRNIRGDIVRKSFRIL